MPGLGHVKLSDLASIVGPHKQPVMRDRYFQPVRLLSEYLRLAEEKTARSPTDQPQPTTAHSDYFSLTQDLIGLNPHSCTEAVRFCCKQS